MNIVPFLVSWSSGENRTLGSADFDVSEVSDELKNKKFAKTSRFSQEYEQTFSL